MMVAACSTSPVQRATQSNASRASLTEQEDMEFLRGHLEERCSFGVSALGMSLPLSLCVYKMVSRYCLAKFMWLLWRVKGTIEMNSSKDQWWLRGDAGRQSCFSQPWGVTFYLHLCTEGRASGTKEKRENQPSFLPDFCQSEAIWGNMSAVIRTSDRGSAADILLFHYFTRTYIPYTAWHLLTQPKNCFDTMTVVESIFKKISEICQWGN